MGRLLGIFTLACALAGCSGDGDTRTATVVGELTYLERIGLPPDAQMHVTVRAAEASASIERRIFDGRHEILAQHSAAVSRPPPIPFALRYQTAGIDASRDLAVEAWISAGEQVLFASTETAWVQVAAGAPVRLMLRRPRHLTLSCADGSRPGAAFPMMGQLAFLEGGGAAPIALRARPVASGFHYAADGHSLRGRGDDILLRRPNAGETRCEPLKPTLPSPTIRR